MANSKVCMACGEPAYSVDQRAVSEGPMGLEVFWLCRPCLATVAGGPAVLKATFQEQVAKPAELHWS